VDILVHRLSPFFINLSLELETRIPKRKQKVDHNCNPANDIRRTGELVYQSRDESNSVADELAKDDRLAGIELVRVSGRPVQYTVTMLTISIFSVS
jgi:hypothetical protein